MRAIADKTFVMDDDDFGLRADIAWLNFYGFVQMAGPAGWSPLDSFEPIKFSLTDKGWEAIGGE